MAQETQYKIMVFALLSYWILTSIIGCFVLSKQYIKKNGYLTIGNIIASIVTSIMFSWVAWPLYIDNTIVYKKNK